MDKIGRLEIICKINAQASGFLREEIDHQMTVEREYEYDELDALFDTEDNAEGWGKRNLLTACRRLLIEIGFYRVMPQSEIANTWVSGGTKWDFRLDGQPYTGDYSREAFERKLQ